MAWNLVIGNLQCVVVHSIELIELLEVGRGRGCFSNELKTSKINTIQFQRCTLYSIRCLFDRKLTEQKKERQFFSVVLCLTLLILLQFLRTTMDLFTMLTLNYLLYIFHPNKSINLKRCHYFCVCSFVIVCSVVRVYFSISLNVGAAVHWWIHAKLK